MLFENQEINIDQLPSLEATSFQKLAKNYVAVRYIGNAIFFLILLIGLFVLKTESPINISQYPRVWYALLAFWFLWLSISFLLVKLGYDIRGYVLRDKDISHRQGVLFKSTTTIPFNRVQHCEISQGPIQRLFDLHTLEIFTAGGGKSDLSIPGLQGDTAQQIKDFIVKKAAIEDTESLDSVKETFIQPIPPVSTASTIVVEKNTDLHE